MYVKLCADIIIIVVLIENDKYLSSVKLLVVKIFKIG